MKEVLSENWKHVIELIKTNGGSTDIQWDRLDPESLSRYAKPERLVTGLAAECKNGNQINCTNMAPAPVNLLASPMGEIDKDTGCQWKI